MPIIIDENGRREVSQEEYSIFLNSLSNVWDKENHMAVINELHTQLFNEILVSYNYLSMGELLFWESNPLSEYYEESKAILDWFVNTYKLVTDYANVVTEETKINPKEFIDSLQKL
jgi:hypothetical protein